MPAQDLISQSRPYDLLGIFYEVLVSYVTRRYETTLYVRSTLQSRKPGKTGFRDDIPWAAHYQHYSSELTGSAFQHLTNYKVSPKL